MILGTNYLKKATPVFLIASLLYKFPIFQVFQSPVSLSLSLSFLICLLKLFLLILGGFYIMHPCPTHLPIPLLPPFTLATPSPQKNLKVTSRNKTKQKNLSVEVVVWSSELHSVFFRPYIFTCKYSLQ